MGRKYMEIQAQLGHTALVSVTMYVSLATVLAITYGSDDPNFGAYKIASITKVLAENSPCTLCGETPSYVVSEFQYYGGPWPYDRLFEVRILGAVVFCNAHTEAEKLRWYYDDNVRLYYLGSEQLNKLVPCSVCSGSRIWTMRTWKGATARHIKNQHNTGKLWKLKYFMLP